MSKPLNSRSREVAEAIRDREPFTTYGALRAETVNGRLPVWDGALRAETVNGRLSVQDAGRLSGEDLAEFRKDPRSITYVVYSYATPIAWVRDGVPYRVRQRFSMTTSHHQGQLYLLGDEAAR